MGSARGSLIAVGCDARQRPIKPNAESVMKLLKPALIAAALSLTMGNVVGQTAPPEHETAAHATLELNAGQKWETDAPLRQGMANIHNVVSTALPAAQSGKMTSVEYDTFANDVTGQITYIVQNCKLEPKADAQLHVLLADIMSGLSIAKGEGKNQDRAQGVVKVAQSVNNYGKYFDQADLRPIETAH